jgi:superfamily II DNA/RNA helicase
MLATPNSIRGLDFADLTHVYTLYLPVDDTREYLHLAGRVGRIGQMGSVAGKGGRVTSILRPDEAEQMVEVAKQLNFSFIDIAYETGEVDYESSDVEEMRRYLEDKLTLISLAEDPVVDLDKVEKSRPQIQYDDEDDSDEDDDDIDG